MSEGPAGQPVISYIKNPYVYTMKYNPLSASWETFGHAYDAHRLRCEINEYGSKYYLYTTTPVDPAVMLLYTYNGISWDLQRPLGYKQIRYPTFAKSKDDIICNYDRLDQKCYYAS